MQEADEDHEQEAYSAYTGDILASVKKMLPSNFTAVFSNCNGDEALSFLAIIA